jgi:NAD+ synthetase
MALSNKFGHLLLSTGNKAEMAVGYCTLYGDACGGLAVLADTSKKHVYEIAAFVNSREQLIPQRIIDRPPTAELKPNQTDQDDLPPYDILDGIVKAYIEEGKTAQEIIAAGFSKTVVRQILPRIDANEYKRRQCPPGIKITPKALSAGRRMPIARGYTHY